MFKQGLQEVASPRCRALREKVAAFSFTVKYVQGKSHYIADALSRYPLWGAAEDGTEHELTSVCFAMRQEVAISQLDVAAGDDEEYMAVREAIIAGHESQAGAEGSPRAGLQQGMGQLGAVQQGQQPHDPQRREDLRAEAGEVGPAGKAAPSPWGFGQDQGVG